MITNKEAIKAAVSYVKDIFNNPENLMLEEIELSEDSGNWLITVGFDSPVVYNQIVMALSQKRIFKVIKINANTGEIVSMKIREILS